MKNIFLFIAVALCITTSAQTIKLDSNLNLSYAETQPVRINFFEGTVNLSRVYVGIDAFNIQSVTFHYNLSYIKDGDPTGKYTPIVTGNMQLPINTTATIDMAFKSLFNYIADSMAYNIEYK